MKKLIVVVAAACGSKPAPVAAPPIVASAPTVADPADPAVHARADIGAWGFDIAGMNRSVSPGDSFFQYANGTWLASTPIPPDKSNYGMFGVLEDKSDARTKEIILGAKGDAGSEERKVADLYQSFMDEPAIEAKGMAPIQPELDRIAAIKDRSALVAAFADASRHLRTNPFFTIVAQDDKDPDHYIANLAQGGLGLPDRDMYDPKHKQFEPLRAGYKLYLAKLLTLVGARDADKRAAAVYALEEKLAAVHWTRIQNRDPVKTYNKWTPAELAKQAPGVDWKRWLDVAGLANVAALDVNQPSAIVGQAKLVKSERLETWKDYLIVHLVDSAAPMLSKPFVDAHFDMHGRTLSGTPQLKDRWKRGVDLVTHVLGEAVGKLYVAKYFTPEAKAHADALVRNILAAMGKRLDGLTWMSDETKAKAKGKLATYNPKIGYPNKWRDYGKLDVVAGDPVGNASRAAAFEYDRLLARIDQPVDRDEWGMTPMTINAYYNPGMNEIVFPAAILQPPFFDPNADDAINYGGIGAVIGHEVSHGFDDQGSQYDERGALRNWWTKDDLDKFKNATGKLVAQYDGYCPFAAQGDKPKQCVKGELTLGENIADLAGLTIAYDAYKLSLGGKDAPILDGTTGDQRFFLGWAQVWRRLYRDQELANRLVTDSHSPSEFRVATIRNLDAWYAAFAIKPSDALYLAPDKRVRIW
jgi:putative endopeptidase